MMIVSIISWRRVNMAIVLLVGLERCCDLGGMSLWDRWFLNSDNVSMVEVCRIKVPPAASHVALCRGSSSIRMSPWLQYFALRLALHE